MKLRVVFASVVIVLAMIASTPARADLLSDCGSCFGSTYLLQYNPTPVATNGSENTYDVFLTIDTSGYNGTGSYLNSVAIKIASSDVFGDSSLVAAPGGVGAWTFTAGGLSASGCNGSGSGFICAQDSTHAPVPGGTYAWEFHYATTDALLLGSLGSSVKALYVDSTGKQAGITSEDITLQGVPEPSTLALFGTGLISLAGLVRRRTSR